MSYQETSQVADHQSEEDIKFLNLSSVPTFSISSKTQASPNFWNRKLNCKSIAEIAEKQNENSNPNTKNYMLLL